VKTHLSLAVVVHASNPSYLEGGELEDCGSRKRVRPDLKQEAGHGASFPESSYTGGIGRRIIDPVKKM
jgi:hypothetical protein